MCSTAEKDLHTVHVLMPSILDSKEGQVLQWLKAEGDHVQDGESLCQVEIGDMIVEITAPFAGILADIIAAKHQPVKSGVHVAVVCDSKDSYLGYVEAARLKVQEEELLKSMSETKADKVVKPSSGTILREIKHMVESGKLDAKKDAEFVAQLQKLARKGNPELLAAFEAAFEGATFSIDQFDADFFLDNARAVVEEYLAEAKAK